MADAERGTDRTSSIVELIRDGVLDAELAALLWLLSEGGLPVNLAAANGDRARAVAGGLAQVTGDVGVLAGASLEDVLAGTTGDPARLGVVVVLAADRVAAAHYVRPPLRDAGGHIREQRPAVLVTWEPGLGSFEHFAWGVLPELAERIGQRSGDVEVEHDRRREYLAGLVAAGLVEHSAVRAALAGYRATVGPTHRH